MAGSEQELVKSETPSRKTRTRKQSAYKFVKFLQLVGTVLSRANTMYILAIVVIAGLVWGVLGATLDDYAKGIITLVLGRFLGYLDVIYNFEFGSTRSSKSKDATITNLTSKSNEEK